MTWPTEDLGRAACDPAPRKVSDLWTSSNAVRTGLGAPHDALGLLAATLNRFDEGYFSAAAATHERIGAAWPLAKTHLGWGAMLAAHGEKDSREMSLRLLRQALSSARARGYALIELRALQALESLGVEQV
jgi:hypothetical protein